ncbi:MAG: hypothetical protein JJU33_14400 [Phycisphaerales bacterium]|nr:hypothetical protein [Phycisphaerales bacterium]
MTQRMMTVLAVLCALAAAAMAKPPAFSDLTLEEAKEAAAEQDRVIVVVRHDPMDLNNEIMRQYIWTDPRVEALMAEHAIGVWMSPEEAPRHMSRTGAVMINHRGMRIGFPLFDRASAKTVARWLRDPGDRRLQLIDADEEWDEARSMFHDVATGQAPADDAAADLCIRMWKALPIESHGFWAAFPEHYGADSFLASTRLIAEAHPRVLDELIELRDRLEATLADEQNAVDRWHWMLLNAEALDDRARVVRWIEGVHNDEAHLAESVPLARLIVDTLDKEQQWSMMYDYMAEPWSSERAFGDGRRVGSLQASLHSVVRRWERAADDPERADQVRRPDFGSAMLGERRLHVGALASGEFASAARQLAMMRYLGPLDTEATGDLIAFAGANGLAHPLHLPFINDERDDHREIAASIRRKWPDADEIAEKLYAQEMSERTEPGKEDRP